MENQSDHSARNDKNKVSKDRRNFLKKAVYVPPALVMLSSLVPVVANAFSEPPGPQRYSGRPHPPGRPPPPPDVE
jgi:hypothetical protein